MKISKKLLLILFSTIIGAVLAVYCSFLFLLPKVIQSERVVNKVEDFVYSKTGVTLDIDGIRFKPYPSLNADLNINRISASKDNDRFLDISKSFISFRHFRLIPETVTADYLFFDKTKLPQGDKKGLDFSSFEHSKLPKAAIKKFDFILVKGQKISADNLSLSVSQKVVNVKAQNLPVNALELTFVHYIKLKDKKKNFIENFYDFSGRANVDLSYSKNNLKGHVITKGLGAKTVKFNIPIKLPDVDFTFAGDKITAATTGKFGTEDVYTDLDITNLFSENRLVRGSVKSVLTERFAAKYTPEYKIKGTVPACVEYKTQNKIVTVKYYAQISNGSNVYYKHYDLGLMDRDRRIYAETVKKANDLFLNDYDYSFVDNGKVSKILKGNGLFVSRNGHLNMDYITCQTVGDAPVSITGSFGRYIDGGTFNGNLRYYHPKKLLTGDFELKNSKYKNFYLSKAVVKADENNLKAAAEGTFENSPYTCYLDAKNSFEDAIIIHDIHLYLKKYIVKRGRTKSNAKLRIADSVKQRTWEVQNGTIVVDEIRHNKIFVNNVELAGSLKDGIVTFIMPDISFAEGTLSAEGTYDIDNEAADARFTALKINSNIAADMFFNLRNQVEGYANVFMDVRTFDGLEKVDAHTTFSIENGALTKIGSTEFLVKTNKKSKKSLKFKLTDIINVDVDKMKALRSNIYGSFDIHNHKVENVELFSQHKYLSLFTEGCYNINEEYANITVWGKYNKNAQKHIKILFIPLSWITKIVFRPEHTKEIYREKLERIPSIEASTDAEVNFAVRMRGNLNDNSSIKVEMKSIK